jgi:hypothetical protein
MRRNNKFDLIIAQDKFKKCAIKDTSLLRQSWYRNIFLAKKSQINCVCSTCTAVVQFTTANAQDCAALQQASKMTLQHTQPPMQWRLRDLPQDIAIHSPPSKC